MKRQSIQTIPVYSITQQHQLLGLEKPKHPLFHLFRFENFPKIEVENPTKIISDLYQITLKKDCPCKTLYGQTAYDFDEGVMSFFSPKQVSVLEAGNFVPQSGWLLSIHPDFFRGYSIAQKIKNFGFFQYAVNEALILSEEEQMAIELIFGQIEKEANLPIDRFSQDVIISNIDLLLTYCNRYYHRQFIVRKHHSSELLVRFENLLEEYFSQQEINLPKVTDFASNLNISSKYLSDCLKQLTGLTVKQHIHEKLIEKAKEILTGTELSVAEIAYRLGFDYPQSFSKFFMTKTKLSPLKFRHSFN
ncbi:helix-turn-helix domain-containing protein [Algoriphagus litoralis]|uniref:helix-turn-helix domain-containing protein n=1 Tax=Algoriphagus litoralis TaxID=2202829 RepID=UPI000DBAAD49|nr:helix-turn-helix domain-containing protein [Algoriphagus litoralis]